MTAAKSSKKNIDIWATHKGIFLLIGVLCFGISACVTTTITPEIVSKNLLVITPEGAGKFPVIIYYQGTGGDTRRAEKWASWFKTMGVASAIVDNAKIRNRKRNPSKSMYTEDAAFAWDLLKANPKIDTSRFALMGFSRGGQQALEARRHFKGKRPAPSFVFALYPGGWGPDKCFSTHRKPTEVHIFFGDQDDVNRYERVMFACRSLAKWRDNVEFHELKGATHAYDDIYVFTFKCCRGETVRVEPNPGAVEMTKIIIEKAIKAGWSL